MTKKEILKKVENMINAYHSPMSWEPLIECIKELEKIVENEKEKINN